MTTDTRKMFLPETYGFTFVRATTPEEIMLHRTIRAQWFYECGNITAEQRDNADDDGYDSYAVHFLAFLDGKVVGCTRVTLPTHGEWYINKYAELPPSPVARERTGEIARIGVDPSYRGDFARSGAIQLGLIKEMIRLHDTDELDLLITGVHQPYYHRLRRLLKMFKLPCTVLEGATVRSGTIEGYEGYTENDPNPIVLLEFHLRSYLSLLECTP